MAHSTENLPHQSLDLRDAGKIGRKDFRAATTSTNVFGNMDKVCLFTAGERNRCTGVRKALSNRATNAPRRSRD
jgi:hypothetical protein